MAQTIRIGTGSGWWGDRIEPAAAVVEKGALDFLCFETMAEATVSGAQVRARRDPSFPGYDTHLDARMRAVLPGCMAQGVRIVSNQGWINPSGAARRIAELLRELGHTGVRVAAVEGSVITDRMPELDPVVLEAGGAASSLGPLVSAEAYLGAEALVQALDEGARIVVTGRVADPSLFLAPLMHAFGWRADDHALLGAGSGIGHLLECGAQVTGGYFADPGFKDVPRPWDLGMPMAEVWPDGSAEITKTPGAGGAVTLQTVKEQMLYEVHDPAAYITPDVVVDFTTARLQQAGPDRVRVSHIAGKPRTGSEHYGAMIRGPVQRHQAANLHALSFVCHGALGGGLSRSLRLDNYGKSLSAAILAVPIFLSREQLQQVHAGRLAAAGVGLPAHP